MSIIFKERTLDGKKISYTNETIFLVQVGKGPKGSYKTKYSFTGDISQAIIYYKGINIGNGYKKRLFVPSFNNEISQAFKTLSKVSLFGQTFGNL